MTDFVVDLPAGSTVITTGDGVYVGISNSADNVLITTAGQIYAGDDGIEISDFTPVTTATGSLSIENSGIIRSTSSGTTITGRAINVDLPLIAPATVTITNHAGALLQGALGEAIVITGDSADTITNEGTIIGSIATGAGNDSFNLVTGSSVSGLIDGGTGLDTINLSGSGPGSLQDFSGIEVINVNQGAWTVDLQSGPQTLRLANAVIADGSFDGAINNLGLGDTVNLAGIGLATSATLGPNNLLTIAGGAGGPVTVQLDPLQNFAGTAFQLIDDGAGGTNLLLASQSTVDITGLITATDIGILLTVSADDPGAGWTVTNSGTIDSGGDNLQVIADPAVVAATGTFIVDNSGTMTSATGHAINFDLPLTSPGSVSIINHASGVMQVASGDAIVISGSTNDTVTNEGAIIGGVSTGAGNDTLNLATGSSISGLIDGGPGTDTINLTGVGQGTLQNLANIDVINLAGGTWTLAGDTTAAVNFQSGAQTLSLGSAVLADGDFDGTINGLGLGDTINLASIGLATSATLGPNNLLTISGGTGGPVTLQLDPTQDFTNTTFQLAADGTGGTNLQLIEAVPGVELTVSASEPAADFSVTNSGIIESTGDSVRVTAEPGVTAATGSFTIDNSGTMKSTFGHAINFDLPLASPGSVTILNRASGLMQVASGDAIVISGSTNDTVTNEGSIIGGVSTGAGNDTLNLVTGSSIAGLVNGGLGTDTVNLSGAGQGTLQSFANIEVINVNDGTWTLGSEGVAAVNLQSGSQTLRLANSVLANGSFSGTINNFASGDLIGLAGIGLATSATLGANNVLTIAGGSGGPITLQLDPAQNFSGLVFALTSDGAGGTNIALAPAASGGGAVIGGSSGSDAINSGNGNDIVVSGDGNDTVSTGNGNDFIQAGNGNSTLNGDNGNDTIIAGNGNNHVNAGNGDDRVTVGSGSNVLDTANGNDVVAAGYGDNTISTGNGDDSIGVGNGNNRLDTANGNDTVIAGDGDNRLSAGNGNDTITVGDGDNILDGGNGADIFHVGSGDNRLTGGNGDDTFVFAADLGKNIITDFGKTDTIEFDGVFADFQDLLDSSTQVGANTVIALDADHSVTLLDVSLSKLHASDFVLA